VWGSKEWRKDRCGFGEISNRRETNLGEWELFSDINLWIRHKRNTICKQYWVLEYEKTVIKLGRFSCTSEASFAPQNLLLYPSLIYRCQNLLLYSLLIYRWKVSKWIKCSKFHLLCANSSAPHSYYFFSRFFSVSLPHYCAFIKIWNICKTEYEFHFRKMWNEFCNPFHKIFNFFLWNGLQNPFHIFLKQNSYSVSRKIWNICGTKYDFSFHKNVKRIL